jgi:hypothetical protein
MPVIDWNGHVTVTDTYECPAESNPVVEVTVGGGLRP